MGNIENREDNQSHGKLKSLKDIQNDMKIMNDIFGYHQRKFLKLEMKASFQI